MLHHAVNVDMREIGALKPMKPVSSAFGDSFGFASVQNDLGKPTRTLTASARSTDPMLGHLKETLDTRGAQAANGLGNALKSAVDGAATVGQVGGAILLSQVGFGRDGGLEASGGNIWDTGQEPTTQPTDAVNPFAAIVGPPGEWPKFATGNERLSVQSFGQGQSQQSGMTV